MRTGAKKASGVFSHNAATTVQPACATIFTGRLYDPETQIYWYRARYYSPILGRFVGRDLIMEENAFSDASQLLTWFGSFPPTSDSLSLYEFEGSNSLKRLDPSGLVFISEEDMDSLTEDCDPGNVGKNILTCLTWQESGHNTVTRNGGAGAIGLGQMTEIACAQVDLIKKWPKGKCWKDQNSGSACAQLRNTSIYLAWTTKTGNNDIREGLRRYGPGGKKNGVFSHYADPILACSVCIDFLFFLEGDPHDTVGDAKGAANFDTCLTNTISPCLTGMNLQIQAALGKARKLNNPKKAN